MLGEAQTIDLSQVDMGQVAQLLQSVQEPGQVARKVPTWVWGLGILAVVGIFVVLSRR